MDIKSIINKKSLGKKLTSEEINFFVENYSNGIITDYQASALLMAIKINGMDEKETFALTNAMVNSGEILDLSDVGTIVDKHSTGGVSDTTSLAIAPICAACGVKMFKLSGRGLGHTGGTIDKLEAFDGYRVDIDENTAKQLLIKNGAVIVSANKELAPADKKLYTLRDTTATIESIPLIASSIMSKKIASGADIIVLDVKYGKGAFMKTKKDAITLAKLMVKIGENAGKKVDYFIGDMNEPLGYNIGNRLESYEAIELLSGKQGKLRDATFTLAAKCVSLALDIDYQSAYEKVKEAVDSKKALEKFKVMIKDQGGATRLFRGLGIKPTLKIKSKTSGTLTSVDCEQLGLICGELGASRKQITDQIDYNVGIKTFHKIGDNIKQGDVIFEVFAKDKQQAETVIDKLVSCYKIV